MKFEQLCTVQSCSYEVLYPQVFLTVFIRSLGVLCPTGMFNSFRMKFAFLLLQIS